MALPSFLDPASAGRPCASNSAPTCFPSALERRRQPSHDLRKRRQQRDVSENNAPIWHAAAHDVAERPLRDTLYDEQVDAEGWRDLPQLEQQHQNDTEPHRIEAIGDDGPKQQWNGEHDHTNTVDQATENAVHHDQRKQERVLVETETDEPLRELRPDAGIL